MAQWNALAKWSRLEGEQPARSPKAADCAYVPGRHHARSDRWPTSQKANLRSLPMTVVASRLGKAGRLLAATLFAAAVTAAAGNASASIDRTFIPTSPVQNGIVMPPIETHRAGSNKSPSLRPGEYQVAPDVGHCADCWGIGPRRPRLRQLPSLRWCLRIRRS